MSISFMWYAHYNNVDKRIETKSTSNKSYHSLKKLAWREPLKAAFKYFINDIKRGENIDVYIILVLSLIFTILSVIGIIQVTILAAGILATLSIQAYSMLATRRILVDFSQNLTTVQPGENIPFKNRNSYGS